MDSRVPLARRFVAPLPALVLVMAGALVIPIDIGLGRARSTTPSLQPAISVLATAPKVDLGGATDPHYDGCFFLILEKSATPNEAIGAFHRILSSNSSTPAAKIYAFVGLQIERDPDLEYHRRAISHLNVLHHCPYWHGAKIIPANDLIPHLTEVPKPGQFDHRGYLNAECDARGLAELELPEHPEE